MEISSSTLPAVAAERATMFVALELSKSSWLVALHSPIADKVSLHRFVGGDVTGLLALIARKQTQAEARLGRRSGFCPATRLRGGHTAGDLVVPENLSLVFLPPYSPELNPIERLWLHLRDNRLSHCVFQTIGEIVDTCCDAWNWLLGQTGRLRSLCSYPWLEQVGN